MCIYLICLFLGTSCSDNEAASSQEYKTEEFVLTKADTILIYDACHRFYYSVVKSIGGLPRVKVDDDGYLYFNLKEYLIHCEKVEFYSDEFIQKEEAKYQPCFDYLNENKIKDSTDVRVDSDLCDFRFTHFFLDSNIFPSYKNLTHLKLENKKALVEMHFYSTGLTPKEKHRSWDKHVFVLLEFIKIDQENWKINRVERVFNN
jgi:hypothetical protein